MSDAMINLAPEGAGSSVGQGITSLFNNAGKGQKLFMEFWNGIINNLREQAEKEDYSEVVGNDLEEAIRLVRKLAALSLPRLERFLTCPL